MHIAVTASAVHVTGHNLMVTIANLLNSVYQPLDSMVERYTEPELESHTKKRYGQAMPAIFLLPALILALVMAMLLLIILLMLSLAIVLV